VQAIIDSLRLYPVKGCRGFEVARATLAETGLEVSGVGDREWVVVDDNDEFLSQREAPAMALIETRLTADSLRIRAPGMLQLDVPFETEGEVVSARIWNDQVAAVMQGAIADAWFSQFLGLRCRLLRFDPETRRLSNQTYTGPAAPYKFADAFALLICSVASLADLNSRLLAKGKSAVTLDRFRPNIVLDGVTAFEEDYIDHLTIGEAQVRVVKPCIRCAVPNVDPMTGIAGAEPGITLAEYRNRPELGGVVFGVNSIIATGAGSCVSAHDAVKLSLRF